ncbi:hypothetical protein [Streptomyces paludis]|uniref:Uncharacterized protein n=1 Tax=Streptomyces paludis TaxID=2282738 RepID=A0A345HZQ6_9ACTN|nr:hypothetical protein [Streptomyces paludis]AXG82180.1 hypothetical protein DVK44_35690 [Streptomyces paludis]
MHDTTIMVFDHAVSPVVPVRATPGDRVFRRAALLTCEECGEDFRVGYFSRSEALRRFRGSYGLWMWLVVLAGYATFLGLMFTVAGLFRDLTHGEPGAIFALLAFGVCGILPVAMVRECVQELNFGFVRLADPEEPPPEAHHIWIRTPGPGTDGTRTAESAPE